MASIETSLDETLAVLLDPPFNSSKREGVDNIALILPRPLNATLSYPKLKEITNSFRTSIVRDLGVGTGSVVAMSLPNSLEFVVAFLGVGIARSVSFQKRVFPHFLTRFLGFVLPV